MSNTPNMPPVRAKGMVHKMVADVAKGVAREHWEMLAFQNEFYKSWPDPDSFVRAHWQKHISVARAILTGMLGNPQYDEDKKALIFDALLKDGTVAPKAMATPASPIYFPTTKS